MVKKRCAWGTCKSDNRYMDRDYMQGVTFAPFPKPKTQREKCLRWIRACGRPEEELNVGMIGRHHFVCSKHFMDDTGPTRRNPDPIPADPTVVHRRAHKKGAKAKLLQGQRRFSEKRMELAAEALIMLHEPDRSKGTSSSDSHEYKANKTDSAEHSPGMQDVPTERTKPQQNMTDSIAETEIDMVELAPVSISAGHVRLGSSPINMETLSLADIVYEPTHILDPELVRVSPVIVIEPTCSEKTLETKLAPAVFNGTPCETSIDEVPMDSQLIHVLARLASVLSTPPHQEQLTKHLPVSLDCSVQCTNCHSSINPTLTEILKILSAVSNLSE